MSRALRLVGLFVLSGLVGSLSACDSTEGGAGGEGNAGSSGASVACAPSSPDVYDGAGFEQNAAVELELRARLGALTQPIKDAELDLTKKLAAADLKALFDAGSPSLRSATAAPFASSVDGWLDGVASAADKAWAPTDPPPPDGGQFGSDLVSARGLAFRQVIEKGMFAATHLNHALTLMAGTVTPATVDRIVAVYGAHPSFPGDDKAMANPDVHTALYAERRDKKDGVTPGMYTRIKRAFVRAKAAAGAGSACDGARDAALAEIKVEWEKVLAATAIFYMNDTAKKLSVDPPTTSDQAAGLHSLSEGVGFVLGLRALPASARVMTDAQADEVLALLGSQASGDEYHRFVTDTAAQLPRLAQVTSKLSVVYGFSADELVAFKTNN